MTPEDVIACAESWVGTPFHHQASIKGVGADCAGFLKGVALETGLVTPELAATWPTDYSMQPSAGQLRRLTSRHLSLVPLDSRAPGDIVLMRFAEEPQHLGMITARDPDYVIHCGQDGVVEGRIDSVWRARICRVYRFPALTCNPPPPPPARSGGRDH